MKSQSAELSCAEVLEKLQQQSGPPCVCVWGKPPVSVFSGFGFGVQGLSWRALGLVLRVLGLGFLTSAGLGALITGPPCRKDTQRGPRISEHFPLSLQQGSFTAQFVLKEGGVRICRISGLGFSGLWALGRRA